MSFTLASIINQEVLKQDLHKPIKVEKQVMILYALTKGFLDDIPIEDINRFEEEFYSWLDHNRSELLAEIKETEQLLDDEKMAEPINEFKKTFAKSSD